jgi:hypothetical protein
MVIRTQLEEFLRKIITDVFFLQDYADNSPNVMLRNSLLDIIQDCKENALLIGGVIENLGGSSTSYAIVTNKPIDLYSGIDNSKIYLTNDIVTEAYNLANVGITIGSKLIQDNPTIDHNTYRTLNLIVKDYQKYMNILSNYSFIN